MSHTFSYSADINECYEIEPCDQTCTNTIGSFVCGCTTGWRLSGQTTCVGQSNVDLTICMYVVYNVRVYKNHLKMVKGCRIDVGLCKKDPPKTHGTRVICESGAGLGGQRARQA